MISSERGTKAMRRFYSKYEKVPDVPEDPIIVHRHRLEVALALGENRLSVQQEQTKLGMRESL